MVVTFEDVTFTFPGRDRPALSDVYLRIEGGEFALLAGPSAGGKSTLLRACNGLIPQFHGGKLAGRVDIAGRDPSRTPARDMARVAGLVFQEPEAQGIADTVEDEIAFGMEQHGVPRDEMRRRVDRLVDSLALGHLRNRRLATLSGGERQRAAMAAVLALEPALLLLDEPTSQLDPDAAASVLHSVERLREDRDLTVLVAEHRLERLLPLVSRVIEVRDGCVTTMDPSDAAGALENAPAVCRLGAALGVTPAPRDLAEAREWLGKNTARAHHVVQRQAVPAGRPLAEASGLHVAYGTNEVLRGIDITVREGEAVALIGANGCGKTTLFRAISGLVTPSQGSIRLNGNVAPSAVPGRTGIAALVPQDPAAALYRDTVREEIRESLRLRKRPAGTREVDACLARWRVTELADRNPRDLSVGQQQRVAIAAMLAHEPIAWMLDEPTRGADFATRQWLAGIFLEHVAGGGGVIVSTHDAESAAWWATRVICLENGMVKYDLPAHEAFGSCGPRPTQTAQLVAGAIAPGEVVFE